MSTGEPSRKITVPANGLPDLTDTPQKLRLAAKRLRAGTGPVAVDTERAQVTVTARMLIWCSYVATAWAPY